MRGNAHVGSAGGPGKRTVRKEDTAPPVRPDHTHATLLLQAGVNAKIVSERLGHHSVACTLDTYAHVMPGMQAAAVRQLSDLLDAAGGVDGTS